MIELVFLFVSVIIYLSSFIYRRISILMGFIVLFTSFGIDVNKVFVIGIIIILIFLRFKRSGIKDEIL
jgi:hypothetical protein